MEAALKAIAAPHRRTILRLVAESELSAGEIAANFDLTRPAILRLVSNDELSAGEIASHFALTRPAVSQHLSVLKEAGLVSERRNGTRRLYRARPQGLVELKAFLEEFWDERLEALKREAEQEERSKHDQDG